MLGKGRTKDRGLFVQHTSHPARKDSSSRRGETARVVPERDWFTLLFRAVRVRADCTRDADGWKGTGRRKWGCLMFFCFFFVLFSFTSSYFMDSFLRIVGHFQPNRRCFWKFQHATAVSIIHAAKGSRQGRGTTGKIDARSSKESKASDVVHWRSRDGRVLLPRARIQSINRW